MSTPAVVLRPDLPVDAAAAVLVAHGFTAAPVVDDEGRLVGIVTEADLLHGPADPPRAHPVRVASVLRPDPVTTGPDEELADVVAEMVESGIRSVPVVRAGTVVGVLTQRDALRVVARGGSPRDWRRGIRIERPGP